MSLDRKIISYHVRSVFRLFLSHHINPAPWSRGPVGLVVLLVLVVVIEPELDCFVVLVGHPWVACTSGAGVLSVAAHFLVEDVGNSSLDVDGFHNGSIA